MTWQAVKQTRIKSSREPGCDEQVSCAHSTSSLEESSHSLSGIGKHAQLTEKAQQIKRCLLFGDLALSYTIDENPCIGDLLSRWGHPPEGTQVGATKAIAHHDFVPLGESLLHAIVNIGKGRPEAADKLPVLLGSLQLSSKRIVPHEIRGEQVVDPSQLTLVPDFFPHR